MEEMLRFLLASQLDSQLQSILAQPRYAHPKRLNRFEHKVYSQFGEDGIIAEIFRRIGTTNCRFVEFGVESGVECNSTYLLMQGWHGLWIESMPDMVQRIDAQFGPLRQSRQLMVICDKATPENIEQHLHTALMPTDFDMLSIDIDGNDFWVWQAIHNFRPRVVVIEYNATFPPPHDWVMRYDPGHRWDGSICFGASLNALERLGRIKGYSLVGCSLGGANAFFVRDDLVGDRFESPFTAENHFEAPRYYLVSRHTGHARTSKAVLSTDADR